MIVIRTDFSMNADYVYYSVLFQRRQTPTNDPNMKRSISVSDSIRYYLYCIDMCRCSFIYASMLVRAHTHTLITNGKQIVWPGLNMNVFRFMWLSSFVCIHLWSFRFVWIFYSECSEWASVIVYISILKHIYIHTHTCTPSFYFPLFSVCVCVCVNTQYNYGSIISCFVTA